ncbi:nucleotide-binding protein [Helicovermis profundi]|uniref:CobQ/CobB/MinD/ParA nucleotide binding domain-containing protein n=1 Tax=Helicovermis profundi TaxID=3065157 RepID=A0AAU9E6C2_9FIRM|nr:hypothetical protein HLPR_05230 [Clostridia bacterium S502]
MDNRIRIIIGHYGSGKTEFSVNYAMRLAKMGKKVALSDMDIVNPYFRSREKAQMMEEAGIRVISGSRGHNSNIDIPMLNGEVLAPLQDETYDLVIDVGGDSMGSRAIARYKNYFTSGNYDMFFVVNRNRPDTVDADGVLKHIKDIEETIGAKVTGLINNTHMLRETTKEDVMYGQEIVEKVSKILDIPIKYISTLEKVAQQLPDDINGEVFPIKMFMREEWM